VCVVVVRELLIVVWYLFCNGELFVEEVFLRLLLG
jgi:hypothetical protein